MSQGALHLFLTFLLLLSRCQNHIDGAMGENHTVFLEGAFEVLREAV